MRIILLRRIHSKLKTEGLDGLLRVAYRRISPYRPPGFKLCTPLFENKVGLEIGGPSDMFKRKGSLPIYPVAGRIDNCNFGHQTVWEGSIKEGSTFRYDKNRPPGTQYVAEAGQLGDIASSTYDFVLSSHMLEHSANPLKALTEWIRVLKEGGLLVLLLPHRDTTFDHRRPITTLDHLIQDFEQGTTEADMTHLEEILKLHDLSKDPEAGTPEQFAERSRKNFENRCLHQHVFDTQLAVEVVNHSGLQILAVDAFRPDNILLMAKKIVKGQTPQNESFRGVRAKYHQSSPFPSDRRSIK